ncbi:MAG: tripartite tricarboxylate transporter substrate-binding protein [Rhodoferax sp.]|nr:tripartite tricarboxylate transporter substrate-binding protein [Rhodoferax sp.]
MKRESSSQRLIQGTKSVLGRMLIAALGLALTNVGLTSAMAQPGKPIVRVLVGFPPGVGTDTLARIYARALSEAIDVNVVVENRPGAGGQIAAQVLKQATAESNSLMLTVDHQVVMLPLITKTPGFDVKKDLVPVARMVNFYTCLAVPGNSPVKNLEGYIDAVKKAPEMGNFGIPAPGSQPQFLGLLIGKHYKISMNPVPYRGAAPAIVDLIGGQLPAVIVPCDGLIEHRKAGKVRVLAIAAEKRYQFMPDVPTFAEYGFTMPPDSFLAVYAANSMKPELLRQITEATRKMFQSPTVMEKIESTFMVPAYASPEELGHIVEKSTEFWGEQVRLSNFQAQ